MYTINWGDIVFDINPSSPLLWWSIAILIGVGFRWLAVMNPLRKLVQGAFQDGKNHSLFVVWRKFKKMRDAYEDRKDLYSRAEEEKKLKNQYMPLVYLTIAETVLTFVPLIVSLFCIFFVGKPEFEWNNISFFTYAFVIITWLTWTVYHSLEMRKFVRELEKINSPLAPEWTKKIPLLGKKIRSVSKGQSVSFGFGTVAITRRGLKKLSDLERPDYVEVKSMNLKTIRKSDTNESNLTASNLLHDVTSIIGRSSEVAKNTLTLAKRTIIDESKYGAKKIDSKLEDEIEKIVESHTQNSLFWSIMRLIFELIPAITLYFFIPAVI